MSRFLLPAGTLWQRELVRFFRQPSRVVGALVPPIVFWGLIGSGLGSGSLQTLFPGTVVLIVLFTAIFSTISIIEDRHEGFLQSVLVTPIARSSVVLAKIAGGTTLAFIQGFFFLSVAPLVGFSMTSLGFVFMLAVLLLISFGLTGLGFLLAWQLDSTQGFHAIMNLFLMPMWFLSGALFPFSGAPPWLRVVMHGNPLTYGLSALQSGLRIQGHPLAPGVASPAVCLGVTMLFAIGIFAGSVMLARKR